MGLIDVDREMKESKNGKKGKGKMLTRIRLLMSE
jgi:hypothetical protein